MGLVALPGGGADSALASPQQAEDFEQEIVDQYAMAMSAAGLSDDHIRQTRAIVIEFARSLTKPLWEATCSDADRFMAEQRRQGLAVSTRAGKAGGLAMFYEFVIARYEGQIRRATGVVVEQPIDEFNRQSGASLGKVRVPPSDEDVDALFTGWRESIPQARKYLPAARDYFAASLWRRLGLRINETVMLDIRDWRPDLGDFGKLHVRFGKGSRGRGHKARLVPAINGADQLIDWWLAEVRHQYGPDWANPDAPMLPSETVRPRPRSLRSCGDQRLATRARSSRRPSAAVLVGPDDPARASALLRLVALRGRDGHQGDPGTVGPSVAGDDLGLHPRAQRAHHPRLEHREPAGRGTPRTATRPTQLTRSHRGS